MPEFVPVSKSRQRYTFGRAHDLIEMPDMIEVQRNSYHWFYQDDVAPDKRKAQGPRNSLRRSFPSKVMMGSLLWSSFGIT